MRIRGSTCPGLRDGVVPLFCCAPGGSLHREDVVAGLECNSSLLEENPVLKEYMADDGAAPKARLPAYFGEIDCVRSVLCSGTTSDGQPCTACDALSVERLHHLNRTAKRAADRIADARSSSMLASTGGVAATRVGKTELIALLGAARDQVDTLAADNGTLKEDIIKHKDSLLRSEHQIAALQAIAAGCPTRHKLLQLLVAAYAADDKREQKLEGSLLEQLLVGIASGVHGKRRSDYHPHEIAFYITLLQLGGPLVLKYVSGTLNGPSIRTVQQERTSFAYFKLDDALGNGQQGMKIFKSYNMDLAPIMTCEDASRAVPRLDVVRADGKYMVYGLEGGMVEVSSVKELKDEVLSRGLARSIYVRVMVPFVPHGGFLPGHALSTGNTDTAQTLEQGMDAFFAALAAAGATVMGDCGDGAATFRKVVLGKASSTQVKPSDIPPGSLRVDHWVIEMFAPMWQGGPKVMTIDWMHIGWRLRRQLINPDRWLMIGPYLISSNVIYALSKDPRWRTATNILYNDLDYGDKQNQAATLKLADLIMDPRTGKVRAVTALRDALTAVDRSEGGGDGPTVDGTVYGTYLFVTFMHQFLGMFTLNLKPQEAVERAAWVLGFMGHWQTATRKTDPRIASISENFLTNETRQDVIIACNAVVLTAKFMAYYCTEKQVLIECDFSRLSSRFAEYVFQALRCADRTSVVFGMKRAEELLRNLTAQLQVDLEADLVVPPSKRGHPRGSSRKFSPEATGPSAMPKIKEYYAGVLDDASLTETLEEGLRKVKLFLHLDIGPVTGGTPRPDSVWSIVTSHHAKVRLGEDSMQLLGVVSRPGANIAPTAGGAEGTAAEDQPAAEEAEDDGEGEPAPVESESEDDDAAWRRGRVLAAAPEDMAETDTDNTTDADPGQPVLQPKKRPAPGSRVDLLWLALLELARRINAFIHRQSRDRTMRFWTSDDEFREMIHALTQAEQDHLSDDDCVVVLQKGRGQLRARLAVVEGMLAPGGRAKTLKRARRMDRNKKDGVVQLRFLSPMPPTGSGELAYFMTHKMTDRIKKWPIADVAMVVFLDKKLATDGAKGGRYVVDPDHAKELREYCREAGAVLEPADGYAADVEAGPAPLPRVAAPRQQKRKARVDPRVVEEVENVLAGRAPKLSSRGRQLKPSAKALQ